jgi:hypothetical protein
MLSVPRTVFVVLSFVIGVARAATIARAVLVAIFPTLLAAIFAARGLIGLACHCSGGQQGAGDEQCGTQL